MVRQYPNTRLPLLCGGGPVRVAADVVRRDPKTLKACSCYFALPMRIHGEYLTRLTDSTQVRPPRQQEAHREIGTLIRTKL